jgi:hypothetical protein
MGRRLPSKRLSTEISVTITSDQRCPDRRSVVRLHSGTSGSYQSASTVPINHDSPENPHRRRTHVVMKESNVWAHSIPFHVIACVSRESPLEHATPSSTFAVWAVHFCFNIEESR